MEIKITQIEDKVYYEAQGIKREFTYENLDILIDIIIPLEEVFVNAEGDLNNYKLLIEEIIKDVKSEDFKNALKEISNDKTDTDLINNLASIE